MELTAKTLWPLFPLLLLVVVVSLTWAYVYVVRRPYGQMAKWVQGGALACYLLAAVSALASENGAMSANIHRPFSVLAQLLIALAVYRIWGQGQRTLMFLNLLALAAIWGDWALHSLPR